MIADWHPSALDDWRHLSMADVERVAVAVQRWIDANEGLVIAQRGAYHLFVGDHVVRFYVVGHVMRIAQVRGHLRRTGAARVVPSHRSDWLGCGG